MTSPLIAAIGAYNPLANYARLEPFYATLSGAALNGTLCQVAVIGDSVAESIGTPFDQSFPFQLATSLRKRFLVNNSGAGGRGFVGAQNVGGVAGYPFTFVGGAWNTTLGGAKRGCWIATQLTDVATYVPKTNATRVEIRCVTYNGAPAGKWRIDGGAFTPFPTTSGSTTYHVVTATINFAAGVHSIDIQLNATGAAGMFLEGVTEYVDEYTNGGFLVHNLGYTGSTFDFWANQAGAAQCGSSIAAMAPNLVILQLGINDSNTAVGNVDPSTMAASAMTLINSRLRGAGLSSRVPFNISFPYNVTGAAGYTPKAPWANYGTALTALQNQDALVSYTDLNLRMTPTATDVDGLYSADKIHPLAKGSALMGQIHARAVSPF